MLKSVRAAFLLAAGALPLLASPMTAARAAEPDRGARFDNFAYQGRSQDAVEPGPGEYRNPILPGYYPDPSVTRVGDTYYLVNSSFAHYPGLPVFTSSDLVNWRQIGNAIDRPDQFDFAGLRSSRGMFAPDISWHAGTFYLLGTCVDCGGNFVMTAKDAKGPWSAPVWLSFEGIDPSLYWEGDRAFIVNNRAPSGTALYEGHRAIWVQEFDWHAGKMVGAATQIVNGGVDLARKPVWIEGPHLLRRDGQYYLIAAEGGTGEQHSEVVFRSRSVRGPFVPWSGNPILSQRSLDPARANPVTSAGHAKLVETQDGKWWATFLATRPYEGDYYNIGRETFLLPVTWQDGWPRILPADKAIPLVAARPDLPAGAAAPAASGDYSYRDTFDGDRLGMAWIGLRTPRAPIYKLENGSLVLEGATPLGDLSAAPAFVGRRQQHHDAAISVDLRYAPAADGDRAGLAAVQSDKAYLFFGLLRKQGTTRVALLVRDGDAPEREIASQPFAGTGPVTLFLHFKGASVDISYAADGQRATLAQNVDVRFLSTKSAGGFVGTVVGPYAWQARAAAAR
ncbi:glycoside hydrolase family 43 protein [Novosphingobium sp.]|uniref:glycoside hydrolase family 43 protein n=1 Tax=Novosphingobium sp. TaxID=1874826 RepID=UPI003D6D9E3A